MVTPVIEQAVEERNRIPISVPLTASHLSLGFDPRVLQLVRRAIEESGAPLGAGPKASSSSKTDRSPAC